ncbi:MAG TPA: DUF2203 domain-containing protein [Vulgatibacter sp.]|nr:DUF2203 domain-containing protein [Vulgatibacter sp.]
MEGQSPQPTRLFSPEEANALIPSLQLSFATISQVRLDVEELLGDLAGGDPMRVAEILRGEEPPPPGEEERVGKLQTLIVELGQAVEGVVSHGVIVQEIDPGMVDFPSILDGRIVLLSWQFGEPEVQYFHEVEESCDERAPLPDASPILQ